MSTRTIKVSDSLHERLTAIAAKEDTTLAGAIEHSLEVAEEAQFWAEVERTMIPANLRREVESVGGWHDRLEPEDWSELW